jgi:hypothetical protein
MPALHPSELPLDTWKTKIASLKLVRKLSSQKYSPRRIDTVGEVIPFGVGVDVDLKVNRRRMSLGQSSKHRRSLQYIDVIVCSRHSEERMLYPQVVIGDSFKDHTAFPIAAFV